MWVSTKFSRQVLALVCSIALVSSSMGLSGPGGGGGGNNGGGGSSSSGSGRGGNGGGGGGGNDGGNNGGNNGGGNGGDDRGGGENETGNFNQPGAVNQTNSPALEFERKLASLKTVPVPGPTAAELNDVVRDKAAAIALGKALFWDMQAGSDGFTACATCHFNAGADSRTMNQADPGLNRAADSTIFHPGFGPNHQLSFSDFPLHKLSDPTRSNSAVIDDNNNIVGSQGQFLNTFNDVVLGLGTENLTPVDDPVWHTADVSGVPMNVRRSTPRNAPSVINAVFNYRNFWDGRAENIFNGVDPFGDGDPNATLLQTDPNDSNGVNAVHLRLSNSSLASQSVGPPGSNVEMSATGRPFIKIGKKMLSVTPLVMQQVSASDSVLGPYSAAPFTGLNTDYPTMVKAAFQPKWWNSNVVVDKDGNVLHLGRPLSTDEYSQMEYNFSMFWGVAIEMYESTLVSDNSRFDQYMEGNRSALSQLEQRGLDRFQGKGGCTNCHNGAEFTDAAVSSVTARGLVELLENGRWHDVGFHNIGVRPTTDDRGIGAGDPSGLPSLSAAQLASMGQLSGTLVPLSAPVAANGAVKTPDLRNIELTAPYFLNGGQATLEQVVQFYSRGGDFPSTDVDPGLKRAGFSSDDISAVVAFLKSLTDERVRAQSAPFDHPSLTVGDGMVVSNGAMVEQTITIPATGAGGGQPMQKFCDALQASSGQCN